ncbi:MAG TPA: homocysteine S-methyltransferase family protein [Bacteroidota bacterium]|nr:homocysteine S-methyltransferase family protein [Bacteroidota bacterium]
MATSVFLQRLGSGEILVCDGAMGTELQKRGMPGGGCSETYNSTHPETIREIYTEYFKAGSDMIETNTFGCNAYRLRQHSMESRLEEYCAQATVLAREALAAVHPGAAQGAYFISGSIGPTGEMLEPLGEAAEADVYQAFARQVDALVASGVDVLQVETMMAIDEALLAVRAAKQHSTLPVIATMTFEQNGTEFNTMWGVTIEEAVTRLSEAGADVLGANCGNGFDEMIGIIGAMRALTKKPILAKANAGLPEVVDGVAHYRQTPEVIKEKAARLIALGVNIIGGCCGTGPEHIATIRRLVNQASKK